MTPRQLEKFIHYLQSANWLVFGPARHVSRGEASKLTESAERERPPYREAEEKKEEVLIGRIADASDLILDSRLPFYSFKRFFVPEKETLFKYDEAVFAEQKHPRKIALLGMNILDLKAVNLYDQVFEKDPYYQARRRNLLIVGHSVAPEIENNIFEHQYEEDILEHLPFDIFLAGLSPSTSPRSAQGILSERASGLPRGASKAYKIFTGSLKGQRILEHFGYKDYEHVQFSGAVKEGKPDERMVKLRDKLKNHPNPKIWEELGKKCIECGKCTLACPTCFCFRIDDQPSLKEKSGSRSRCWDSCFYREFSEVAGEHKFLNSTAERIHFWYFHKFARIPDEFDFMGCVGCGRCHRVCPVGIDIRKVLEDVENS